MKKWKIYAVVIVLVVVAAAVTYWAVGINKTQSEHKHSDAIYTCSMHPQITSDQPGACPICGMDLVKKSSLGHNETDTTLGNLLLSPNKFVVGNSPTISPIDTVFQQRLTLPGEVAYNPNTAVNIAAKVGGRIEKLYVNFVYQHIQKGQKLFDLYSPELLTEQQNYLYLLQNDAANKAIISAAKQKLLLYGMTEAQVLQLGKTLKTNPILSIYSPAAGVVQNKAMQPAQGQMGVTMPAQSQQELGVKVGMYITKGETVFKLLSTQQVWGVFYLLSADVATVREGISIDIIPESDAKNSSKAKISFVETQLTGDTKSTVVRVEMTNQHNWPIGLRLNGTIQSEPIQGLWLPKESVINLGAQLAILVAEENGFRVTYVKTGITAGNYIKLIDLSDTAVKVAQNAQYWFDNESFISQ